MGKPWGISSIDDRGEVGVGKVMWAVTLSVRLDPALFPWEHGLETKV